MRRDESGSERAQEQLEPCDYRINTWGNFVVKLLFVSDVAKVLRCSKSRAYEIIRECRGYPAGRGRAAVRPSVFRDWCMAQFGRALEVPSHDLYVPKPTSMSEERALAYECARLKAKPESDGERKARAAAEARAAAKDETGVALPAGLQMTQPRTARRKGG